jgi:xylulokinase
MRAFLGLDIGTSGVKALLVDERGRLKGSVTMSLPLSTPKPGWAEQHPDDWWKASVAAIKQVLRKSKLKPARIGGVGLSGQMHSSVFLDRSGRVIRPALLWCDGRTSEECREITALVGEERLREWVANPALEGFTLPKVLWLRRHEPSAFRRLDKVVLAKDYIRYRLSGELASEPSDASGTLMYDTAHRRWSRELMDAVGLPMSLLPDVGGSSEVLGRVSPAGAKVTGLAAGTPVVGGGADNACGAVGVGVVSAGEAVASWGTSGTVLAPLSEPKVDAQMRAHTFCHALPDTWYVMGVMLTAGGAVAWHKRELAKDLEGRTHATLLLNQEAAEIPIGAEGLLFLPYLQGERTPHRDASARGAFVGLSLAHSRAHLSRAVLEGVCFGMLDSLTIIRAQAAPLSQILLTGGGARSPLVRHMQADVYGLPVVRVNREEGPSFGAALLAAVGVGAFKSVAAACRATLKRLPKERPDRKAHAEYQMPYQRFRALYPALKAWLAESQRLG